MNQSNINLYTLVTSPYGMKVHCYLLYKGIDFAAVYVKPFQFEKQLPIGRQVPVLEINKEARADSLQLGLWLEQYNNDRPLIPKDQHQRERVLKVDQWVTDTIIPTLFYSIYPQFNKQFFTLVKNNMRLGYCVCQTTQASLPTGLWLLWPLFIHQADFIKRMVKPLKSARSVREQRLAILSELEGKLKHHDYIAATEQPSLADLSCWPLLAVPYMMRLKNMDDFLGFPNVTAWLKRLQPYLIGDTRNPPLVPPHLNPRSI
ncbi:MAG: glutathione S-transferase family protein [Methylococcales bacterium]|nr:glutathione S-transferase family protein [Methylococcales bacterium]